MVVLQTILYIVHIILCILVLFPTCRLASHYLLEKPKDALISKLLGKVFSLLYRRRRQAPCPFSHYGLKVFVFPLLFYTIIPFLVARLDPN